MKSVVVVAMVAAILLNACTAQPSMLPTSRFIHDFSLAKTIDDLQVPEFAGSSSNRGPGASEGGPSSTTLTTDIEFTMREGVAQSFDEKAFLTRLFDQIVKEAGDSGLRAATAVRGDDFFYFRYQAGGHVGVVQLVGARVDNGAKFKVWFSVNELTAEPSAVP